MFVKTSVPLSVAVKLPAPPMTPLIVAVAPDVTSKMPPLLEPSVKGRAEERVAVIASVPAAEPSPRRTPSVKVPSSPSSSIERVELSRTSVPPL